MISFGQQIRFSQQSDSHFGRIRQAGYYPGNTPDHRTLDCYSLLYICAGHGKFECVGTPSRRVAAGDLILLKPGIEHSYGPDPKGGWKEYYVMFDGPVFSAWDAAGLLDPVFPIFRLEPVEFWLKRFLDVLQGESEFRDVPYFVEVNRLFGLINDIVLAASGSQGTRGRIPWLEKACRQLQRRMDEPLNLTAIAKQLGRSYSSFCHEFSRSMGFSPSAYRLQWVAHEACRMLLEAGAKDKEVAARLGFEDLSYFYRRFKRVTGMTPGQFREKSLAANQPAGPAARQKRNPRRKQALSE